jgi:PAS domain S-box-containing protein
MFGLSIVVAVVLATLALWVRFGLSSLSHRLSEQRRLLLAAIVMGCAIAGMHYTGMAAARFVGHAIVQTSHKTSTFLALAITLITVAFTIFVLAANGLLRYRQLFRELSRSEAWMRALLTTTVDGVITSTAGTIREFNASAEQIFGWRRDEIVGQQYPPPDRQRDRLRASRPAALAADGRNHAPARASADVTGRRKDGSIVPIRRASATRAWTGRTCSSASSPTSPSARKMEQALRASEQQFRSLIGNIPGISYRSLVEGEAPDVFISDAVERVTGYPGRDFLGAAPRRSFAP